MGIICMRKKEYASAFLVQLYIRDRQNTDLRVPRCPIPSCSMLWRCEHQGEQATTANCSHAEAPWEACGVVLGIVFWGFKATKKQEVLYEREKKKFIDEAMKQGERRHDSKATTAWIRQATSTISIDFRRYQQSGERSGMPRLLDGPNSVTQAPSSKLSSLPAKATTSYSTRPCCHQQGKASQRQHQR